MDRIIHMGTRGISLAIATTSEAIAGRKGKAEEREASPEELDYTTLEQDLDELEASEEPASRRESDPDEKMTIQDVSNKFLSMTRTEIPDGFQLTPLPKPVMLPQRRPRQRKRGFIRAYAPSLAECSAIDQKTFLNFITTWDSASKASPVFDVINLACFAVGFIPGGIPSAVSTAVGTAAMIAQELQIRYRSNMYLEQVNEAYFKPRGLFVMIMTYKPDMAEEATLEANVTDPTSIALVKHSEGATSSTKKILRRLRNFSGKATSEDHIPECAELVYPMLDDALTSKRLTIPGLPAESQTAVQEYLDRRAQDIWIHENRNSKLAKALPPKDKGYVNRYCDPDHPVNAGSLFGLLTGGTFDPIAMGRVRRAKASARRKGQPPLTEQEEHDAYMGREVRGRVTGTPGKKIPLIEKLVKKDVLYLVVCNLPTEEEKMAVRAMLKKAKEAKD